MSAFGGKGYFVRTPEELKNALKETVTDKQTPALINVMIDPHSERKKQVCVCFAFFFCRLHVGKTLQSSGSIIKNAEKTEIVAREKYYL